VSLRPLLVANVDVTMGGGEVGLRMLASGLAERGHRPLVAVPGRGGFAADLDHVVFSPDPGDGDALEAAAAHCDLVHVYSGRMLDAVERVGITRPVVYHELLPNPDALDEHRAHRADLVICNSRATAARFRSVGARNVEIVYNGVAPPRPPAVSLGLDPRRRTIGIIGGTVLRKGQLDALPALLDVVAATDDVDVVFIGRAGGAEAMRLRRHARASGGRIRLLGWVPDVADHLHELALVLVPSRSEGFGRVAVESLRAGVPVLATRVDGLVEALAGHPDPWLPADRRRWAERIRRELDAPSLDARELRAAAARFDPERFVAEIEQIHWRLATRGARPVAPGVKRG